MSNPGPSMGWKVRREKARAKHELTDEHAAVRAARQKMYDEQAAESAAAAAEHATLQARARCSCPVCDSAPVDIDLAARVITAMQRLPAHIVNDPNVVAALNAVVAGRDIPRASIYSDAHKGMHVPHRTYAAAVESTATDRTAAVTPKAEPIIPNKGKRKSTIAELALRADDGEDQGD